MKRLILAVALLPGVALAQPAAPPASQQPAPAQFCISPILAQALAGALQQDAAMLALLNDAAQEPQRQAAMAKQRAEDGKAGAEAIAKPTQP